MVNKPVTLEIVNNNLNTVNNNLNVLVQRTEVVKAEDSVSATNNTSGLTVTLDKGSRPSVNVKYDVSDACDIYIETSDDGSDWYELDHITVSGATKKVAQYPWIGDRYIRARCPTTGIVITIKISAGG